MYKEFSQRQAFSSGAGLTLAKPWATVNLLVVFQLTREILRFSKSYMTLFFLSLADRPHVDRCTYSWIWAILLLRLAFLGSSLMFHTSELAMLDPFLRALVFHSSYSSIAGTLLRWGTGCLRKSSVLSTKKYCVQSGKASSLLGVSHYRRLLWSG